MTVQLTMNLPFKEITIYLYTWSLRPRLDNLHESIMLFLKSKTNLIELDGGIFYI